MVRKTFSFTNQEVINHLNKMDKGTVSKYLESLVLKDIKNKVEYVTKDEVIKLIKEYGSKIEKVDNEVKNKAISLIDF